MAQAQRADNENEAEIGDTPPRRYCTTTAMSRSRYGATPAQRGTSIQLPHRLSVTRMTRVSGRTAATSDAMTCSTWQRPHAKPLQKSATFRKPALHNNLTKGAFSAAFFKLLKKPCCLPPTRQGVGILIWRFSKLNHPAHRCLGLRFATHLAMCHARLEVRMESLSPFLWGSCIPYNMPVYPGARRITPKPRICHGSAGLQYPSRKSTSPFPARPRRTRKFSRRFRKR